MQMIRGPSLEKSNKQKMIMYNIMLRYIVYDCTTPLHILYSWHGVIYCIHKEIVENRNRVLQYLEFIAYVEGSLAIHGYIYLELNNE